LSIKWLPANVWALFLTLVAVSVLSTLISTTLLHRTALEETTKRLEIAADVQSVLLGEMVGETESDSEAVEKLFKLHEFHGFGETGEFVIGKMHGSVIMIIATSRFQPDHRNIVVENDSPMAEPMRLALTGLEGTLEGTDYRGKQVFAAYHPVGDTGLGVVAKIDVDEVNAPYVKTFLVATAFALMIAVIGGTVIYLLNRSIIHDLVSHRQKMSTTFESIIHALSNTLDQRDPYTSQHQHRVSEIATRVAKELGLDEEKITGIRIGALVHDIGKIGIPAEILNRPGKLNDAEMAVIKNHPLIGHDIMQDVALPWPVDQIISQHHERVDGLGYPHGLKGIDICLEARIISPCDALEAITAHRPYRPRKPLTEAISFLKENRGTSYDAKIVDTLVTLIESGAFTYLDDVTEAPGAVRSCAILRDGRDESSSASGCKVPGLGMWMLADSMTSS
jgi:putative nucleotidyltransferase with HDIG domain